MKKDVKVWSCESVEQLQGCFDCTNWDMLLDSCDNIHDATDVISDYITVCEDMIIPKKKVKVYPNNKPWVSKSLKKKTLNEKKIAFQARDQHERKHVQSKLRKEIGEAKK